MNSTVLFQGQGSYSTSYTKRILKEKRELIRIWQTAEHILDWSPIELLYKTDNAGSLATDLAQPLIFLMEYSCWQAFKDNLPEKPEYLAGHSLGELTALAAAGACSFEDAVRMVKMRGKYMQENSSQISQGMLVLFDCSTQRARELCEAALSDTGEEVYCANFNACNNITLSGSQKALSYIASLKGINCHALKVTKAFHTPFMGKAAGKFRELLGDITFCLPEIPVLSNITSKPYQASWTIKELLCRQITSPVHWTEIMRYMEDHGISTFLQVTDSVLFQSMDRTNMSGVQWGSMEDAALGRIYDFDHLYPGSKRKNSYLNEFKGEILSRMVADPWPDAAEERDIMTASRKYKEIKHLFSMHDITQANSEKAIENLKIVLNLKGCKASEIENSCKRILYKYGIIEKV